MSQSNYAGYRKHIKKLMFQAIDRAILTQDRDIELSVLDLLTVSSSDNFLSLLHKQMFCLYYLKKKKKQNELQVLDKIYTSFMKSTATVKKKHVLVDM